MDDSIFKRSQGFSVAYWSLLSLLLIRFATQLIPSMADGSGEVGLEGYTRVAFFGLLLLFVIYHASKFSFVWAYEPRIPLITLFFVIVVVAQFFILDNKAYNLQGSIKFLFYFFIILVSLFSAIVQPNYTVDRLLKLILFLFLAVLVCYPFLIVKSGIDPLTVLMDDRHRMHFLLGAANVDAHFMATLFMLSMLTLRKSKVLLLLVAGMLYLALLYNGTRSAFFIAILLPIVFYVLYTRRFLLALSVGFIVLLVSLPSIIEFVEVKFARDLEVFENPDTVLAGNEVGGSLSWRIANVWVPMVNYTSENSPIIGNGSNGWDIIIRTILSRDQVGAPHNTLVWAYVNWGIVGLLGALLLIFAPFVSLWKLYLKPKSNANQILVITLICAWIEFIIWSTFANAYQIYGWAVLCILYILYVAAKYAVRWEDEVKPVFTNDKHKELQQA